MRFLGGALSLVLLLAFVAPSGWTQCPPGACTNGMCPPNACNNGMCPPYACANGMCPPQYPRYPGYGYSSSNYYQMPPPYILGGPAYGYSFPYPWAAYCAPAGRSYVAAAYPSCYYYPFSGQSQSFYGSYPQTYGTANTNGSVFATERNIPRPAPTATPTPPPPAKSASNSAPAKTTSSSSKQPTMLPDSISSKKDATSSATSDNAQRPGLFRRLLFWQN